MRVFIFGIGGTGARVITSLVMQLAAGVRPKDASGNVLSEGFSIVPILVDPHNDCSALVELGALLDDYRKIHERLYGGSRIDSGKGFFSVKIETLHDVDPENIDSDSFIFRMPEITNQTFESFIDFPGLDEKNRQFFSMLFSKSELKTNMQEGFYGSPNIGCVALNNFVNSPDFRSFKKAVQVVADDKGDRHGDKIFFIGSLFGGTGASGLPLFITNIRNLLKESVENSGSAGLAQIGALLVMPYFSIGEDKESPINDSDFMIKTRSALSYYHKNLNKYVNNTYYIADYGLKTITPFENDPGNKNNQKNNKAHIVEFIGAASILHFIESNNYEVNEDSGNAVNSKYYAYGIGSESVDISSITLNELGDGVKEYLEIPLMKFYILKHYMENFYSDGLGLPYAKDHTPKLDDTVVKNKEISNIFARFDKLFSEMSNHGENAHNLKLFNPVNEDYSSAFCSISTKIGFFKNHIKIQKETIIKNLNAAADRFVGSNNGVSNSHQRWFDIADSALDEIIKDYQIL